MLQPPYNNHKQGMNEVQRKVDCGFHKEPSNMLIIIMAVRLPTCARSTAPSAVGISTIPSVRLASLASRPSTRLDISGPARAAIKQVGRQEMERKKKLLKIVKTTFALGLKHLVINHKGAVNWCGISLIVCECACFPCCTKMPDV